LYNQYPTISNKCIENCRFGNGDFENAQKRNLKTNERFRYTISNLLLTKQRLTKIQPKQGANKTRARRKSNALPEVSKRNQKNLQSGIKRYESSRPSKMDISAVSTAAPSQVQFRLTSFERFLSSPFHLCLADRRDTGQLT
jgi:hypothetical protein